MIGRKARIALVGTGRMGDIRARLMYANPKIDFCGVVDVNQAAAHSLASMYSAKTFSKVQEAIEYFGVKDQNATTASEGPLDGIVVCTPTFAHSEIIRKAAKHGLHIFSEKPIDETADRIVDLFEICEKNGSNLCCGFQRRFDKTYKAVANAVQGNEIGKPISASIFFADHPCPPIEFLLQGGDIFMDLSAHDVDYIRWALNDDVVSVYATGSSSDERLEKAGVHDNATMVMTFRKGTVVTLTMSRSASYGYDQRCEIFGTHGLASVNNEFANNSVISNMNGVHQSCLKYSFPDRFDAAFATELDVFADTIINGTSWPVTMHDCIATQQIADAARLSASTNEVVYLSCNTDTEAGYGFGQV